MFPHITSFRLALGNALAKSGHLDAAIEQLRQALTLDPQETQAQDILASINAMKAGQGVATRH
jgi:Tfp pilus assembly protein PilF